MTDNPYAPPQSDLTSVDERAAPPEFYVVSRLKFAVLYFATLGLYKIYWFYRNWSHYRKRAGENLWPAPRAVFAIFFVRSLFTHIQFRASKQQIFRSWDMKFDSALLVILMIVANILDRLVAKEIGWPYTDVVALVITIPIFFLLFKAQGIINAVCLDPEGTRNSRFTPANYFWIVVGALVWVMAGAGTFMAPVK